MKHILRHIIVMAIGILSCVSASAQHESEAYISIRDYYSTFLQRPQYGNVLRMIADFDHPHKAQREVVIPGKYFSTELGTYAKVDWICTTAIKASTMSASSIYFPASVTEYPTYQNLTTGLRFTSDYESGCFNLYDNGVPDRNYNLTTVTYESPHPAFEDITVMYIFVPDKNPPDSWLDCSQSPWTIHPIFGHKNPFENCYPLKSIVVLDPNTPLHSIKGVLYKDYDEQQTLMAFPFKRKGAYSIPEPTSSIAPDAFPKGCKITSLTLPVTLTEIMDDDAFCGLTSLHSVIVNWTEPVEFCFSLFSEEQYIKCILVVPEGTVPAYSTTMPWCMFSNIEEQSAGIDVPEASAKELTCDVYNLSGVQCKHCVSPRDWDEGLAPGIYILRMSDGSTIKKSLTR